MERSFLILFKQIKSNCIFSVLFYCCLFCLPGKTLSTFVFASPITEFIGVYLPESQMERNAVGLILRENEFIQSGTHTPFELIPFKGLDLKTIFLHEIGSKSYFRFSFQGTKPDLTFVWTSCSTTPNQLNWCDENGSDYHSLVTYSFLKKETDPRPSFDCLKVGSNVMERAICRSSELSNKDSQLVELYKTKSKSLNGSEKTKLLKTQKEWLKKRNARLNKNHACLYDPTKCEQQLIQEYDSRIQELH